ncbi:hypothetical protein QR98_0066890 [Sarcoptes scabiei]|uniref:Uncharacterized protein n=1 Tax=Sarcoptes scabiei TaxID=52283 RepID=A0A132AC75_SARSC|nr:hypothetical protein QR98_0066890 [Sarcoptes scabiei]
MSIFRGKGGQNCPAQCRENQQSLGLKIDKENMRMKFKHRGTPYSAPSVRYTPSVDWIRFIPVDYRNSALQSLN